MDLISIKFNVESPEVITAVLYDPQRPTDKTSVTRKAGLELVQFAKGLGPCGRWVHKLSAKIDFATVRITQESYSEDMQALHDELENIAALVDIHGSRMSVKGRIRVREIQEEINKSRKVETFVYQLSDVRGRIHAVEWRDGRYWV